MCSSTCLPSTIISLKSHRFLWIMAKKLDVSVPRLVSLVLEGLATEWENDKEDVESTLRSLCLKYK